MLAVMQVEGFLAHAFGTQCRLRIIEGGQFESHWILRSSHQWACQWAGFERGGLLWTVTRGVNLARLRVLRHLVTNSCVPVAVPCLLCCSMPPLLFHAPFAVS